MSDGKKYTVEVKKSKRPFRKAKYYWRVKAINGQILLTSEMYVNKNFVIDITKRFAADLDASWKSDQL